MMTTKLISLRDYSLSYNNINEDNFIPRENLLEEIEEIALGDNKLIIIEGNEGIGKTNILLQFATRHNFNCFTYFINPACKFTAKQDFLMEDLGRQIYYYLNSESSHIIINESALNSLIFNLLRTPGKKTKRLYFILDGLDQIEKSEVELLKPILENLPWSTNNFTFIVSGSIENLSSILPPLALKKSKTFRVIRFSYEETCKLFNWTDNPYAREVHETWNGHPERLCQVKRLLDGGIDIKDFLLRDDVREKNDLLEIEWKQAQIDSLDFNSELIKLISILTFDDNILSFNKVVAILTSDEITLREKVVNTSFLKLKDDDISFVSKSYRQFAIGKLKKYEKKTFALLISYYTDKDDLSSVLNLPSLYDRSQDWSSIINLLTVNNLDLIVSGSQSFADIKKQINYGYKASRSLKKAYDNIFRFSLYRSLIGGLQKSDIRETQIQAYIALDRQEDAFSLISNAILKEDRLKMMIKYAKECKIRKVNIDPLIIKEIQDLLSEIDSDYIDENLIEITTGLAYFLPSLSLEIIEKASGLESQGSPLELLMSFIGDIIKRNKVDIIDDKLKVSITPPSDVTESLLQKFSRSIGFGIDDISENEIIEKVSSIENVADKLFMIKTWIRKNYNSSNILSIIDFSISLLLQSSSINKPTTTSLLEILYPLPFISDKNEVLALINRIDELIVSINSPTSDKIKLQLMIIEAMVIYDMDNANQRIIDLYDLIHQITDYSIKIEAYSDCWNSVVNISYKLKEKALDFLLNEKDVKNDILKSIEIFLNNVANQFEELEDALEIMANIDFDFTLQIINKLNTSHRRSQALNAALDVYTKKNIKDWDVNKIKNSLLLIEDNQYYISSIISIFDSAGEQKEDSINFKDKIIELLPLIDLKAGNSIKCHLLSISIRLLIPKPSMFTNIIPKYDSLIEKLKGFLKQYWSKIDNPVQRIRVGYKLTSSFADVDKVLSEHFFKLTEEISQEYVIDNQMHVGIFMEAIKLMIRVYSGIIKKSKSFSYEKIENLINHVPSNINKLELWAELAVRVKLEDNHGIADEIVSKKIIPVIERYKNSTNGFYFFSILKACSSAIHLSQPEALRLLIENLSIEDKERIISIVCFVSLTKVHESEPFNGTKGSDSFKYQDTIEFINLISMVETDDELYYHIKALCNVCKHFPNNFTREQKTDIKRRLDSLVSSKLPNVKTGVTHNGYLIVSKASILNFNLNQPNDRIKDYDLLDNETLQISNIADRSLVYIILAKECGIKRKKIELINNGFDTADKILSIKEKIQLYEFGLEEVAGLSTDIFNEKLSKVQLEITKLDENDKFPTYRKLIDLAYKHDKQAAKRIISALDSDPARKQLMEPINKHYDKLELEKNALDDYSQFNKIKSRRTIRKITNKMLGELNADKRLSRTLEQTVSLLHTASKLPFFHALPLIEFFIQNYLKNNASNETQLLEFYDATYSNAKLCYNLICNISNKKGSRMLYNNTESETTFVARLGMRDAAFEFIERLVRQSFSKNIFIIDSYFSYNDVDFIKNIYSWSEKALLTVLTSCESNGEFSKFMFKKAWNDISSEEFPQSYFVSASNNENKSPVHDRWILFIDKNSGIRIGTSINAIGGKKISEISTIHASEFENILESIATPLINQKIRDYNGQVVKYETFEF